jgi:protein-S-isoprenylcysteine O-methyltransferase Ste14
VGDADLARRAWRGLALFLLAMLVLLFLTSGSLRYWQGWLYLALFGGAVSAITWYLQEHDPELLRRRLGARPGAEKEPRQKVLQAIAQLAFIALLIVPGLAYRFHRSPIPLPVALLGDLLVILGLWIVFLAFKANSYSSAIIEISPGQPVISTGPYRLVRHPMYAGTEEYLGKVRYRLVPYAW